MKLIYNVTVMIDHEVHDDWLVWMTKEHIPEVIIKGGFDGYTLNKILSGENEGGITYAIQYMVPSQNVLDRYFNRHAEKLRMKHQMRFKDRFVAYRTIMEVIMEG